MMYNYIIERTVGVSAKVIYGISRDYKNEKSCSMDNSRITSLKNFYIILLQY